MLNGEHVSAFHDGFTYTSPVESFAANGYGLYDMTGNVDEWRGDYYGTYAGSSDPTGPGPITGTAHVIRGGNWDSNAGFTHCASRNWRYPSYTSNIIGFRPALPGQ